MQKAPVLFVVFNRPEKTRRVLQAIAAYAPEVIYISSDGPRENNVGDKENCANVQKLVNEGIDWPCRKEVLIHARNKGCKAAVSEAITWFFKHEPYGIILEDDCIPDVSFFDYAADLLRKYESDKRIFSVSGSNFGYESGTPCSYSCSKYMNMWGWATWRRTANQIDYDLLEWKVKSKFSKKIFLIRHLALKHKDFDWGWLLYWEDKLDQIVTAKTDTWDFQWFYAQFKSATVTLYPAINLIQNIGFDAEATHTINNNYYPTQAASMLLPLVHPERIIADKIFDEQFVKMRWAQYDRQSLLWHVRTTKLYRALKSFLKKK